MKPRKLTSRQAFWIGFPHGDGFAVGLVRIWIEIRRERSRTRGKK